MCRTAVGYPKHFKILTIAKIGSLITLPDIPEVNADGTEDQRDPIINIPQYQEALNGS